ncbi:MAG: hydantoinase B/oxoprolinase family protein [Alphaproteobacteria bacterium]
MAGNKSQDLYVDPVTFEVIKHRLWQINDEQGIAIKTISASPIVVEGNDFNVGLFTDDGQLVTAGIGSLVHVGTMANTVQNIIAKAGHIRDGDVFMTNDPFLGALHQNDVVIASPMFRDGEIALWVGNVLHHPDVGGIDEGSFCINARNLYQDPPRYFLKIVDEGELVTEVEYTFVTNSRLPDMVALDLRAQIGAVHVAKTRLDELIDEHGAALIAAVMTRAIDVAERQTRDMIARLPDGRWIGRAYMDGDRVGSDAIHEVRVALTRDGDNLHFDYTGSSPQVDAAVNCTFHACFAGTTVPLYSFLCQGDIDWNDGLKRCVTVTAPEGTVVNARFPAPVSISTVGFRWLVTVAATQAVAKMLDASKDFRDRVCPSWNSSANCNNLFGFTPDGKRVGALLSDHRGAGAAARSFNDGLSHAGTNTSFASSLGNVESAEWKLPLLYLFRRQLPDSGGPGRYRGGLTAAAAMIPYGVDELVFKSTNTAGTEQSNAHGIGGGYPGAGSQVCIVRDSGILAGFKAHTPPTSFDALHGAMEHLPSKADGTLGAEDIFVFFAPGGGGFGDPLERDPERVATDVANGFVSAARAEANYGVMLDEAGGVDAKSTNARREAIRAIRKQAPVSAWVPEDIYAPGDEHPIPVSDALTLDGRDGLHCRGCGHQLTGDGGDALVRTAPLADAGPRLALRWSGDSPNFKLEEIICPSCARLISVSEVRTRE